MMEVHPGRFDQRAADENSYIKSVSIPSIETKKKRDKAGEEWEGMYIKYS